MGWLFLWVLSVFPMAAVRGAVFDDFNQCKQFFFKERPVQGLDIHLPTEKPLTETEFRTEMYRKVFQNIFKQVYNLYITCKDANLQELKSILEKINSALTELKSKLDDKQKVLQDFKQASENVFTGYKDLKQLLDKNIKELTSIQQIEQNYKLTEATFKQFETDLQEVPKLENNIRTDGNNPAYICQTYNGMHYFATLYDRVRRIPLYSAYKMDLNGTVKVGQKIVNHEPQLLSRDQPADQRNLKYFTDNKIERALRWSQATIEDFTTFTRGHLNPAGHHAGGNSSTATMTHTNVAPQSKKMNDNWGAYESHLRQNYGGELRTVNENKDNKNGNCDNLYVVTGVVPGNTWQFGRVNVPSYYWSAHCCTRMDQNNEVPVLSGGALCPNRDDGKVEEFDRIENLEERLKDILHLKVDIRIFDNCKNSNESPDEYFKPRKISKFDQNLH